MLKTIRILFLIFGLITLIFGLPLLVIPGRFLGIFGWEPVDPLISRLLGAALIMMSFQSWFVFQKPKDHPIRYSMFTCLVFCGLGAIGFLRHLVASYYYPFMVWFVFGLLALWTLVWGIFLILFARNSHFLKTKQP